MGRRKIKKYFQEKIKMFKNKIGMLKHKEFVETENYNFIINKKPSIFDEQPLVLGDRVFIHNTDKQRVFLDANELHMTLHMIEHREWEPQIREIICKSIMTGETYVDVGANIGLHSLYASTCVQNKGKIICVEPNSRLMKILKINMEINGFLNGAEFHQKALSNFVGEADFYVYDGHASMSGFMSTRTDFELECRKETVGVEKLDNIISRRKVDLLKIDVEGFEFDVIKGGIETLKNNENITVIIEWNHKDIKERMGESAIFETLNIFKEMDFKVYHAFFGQKLKLKSYDNLMNYDESMTGDLIFTRKTHLNSLI